MEPINFTHWTNATANLPWGVQRVFVDSLKGVAEHGTHMVWGNDYDGDNFPCLVNTAAPMLTTGGGYGIPSDHFGEVVRAFDSLNAQFKVLGINEGNRVSPLAADFLLRNFGELKPEPTADDIAAAILDKNPLLSVHHYEPEVSDDDMFQHLLTMGAIDSGDAPDVLNASVDNIVAAINKPRE